MASALDEDGLAVGNVVGYGGPHNGGLGKGGLGIEGAVGIGVAVGNISDMVHFD